MNPIQKKFNLTLFISGITVVLYAWTMICSVWLAFNSIEYSPSFYLFNQTIKYLCIPFGIATLLSSQKEKTELSSNYTLIMPFTFYLLCLFDNYEDVDVTFGVVNNGIVIFFLLFNEDLKTNVFNNVYWIVQVTNIIALLMWVLFFLNINFGFSTVPYYGEGAEVYAMFYIKWGLFAIYNQESSYRLCGLFNEPGALGTLCALLFIIRFNRIKIWEKATLIATGALTFSLAFYLLGFLFFAIYLIKKGFLYSFLLIAIAIFWVNIPNIDWGNEMVNTIVQRMSLTDSDFGLGGQTRVTSNFDSVFNYMLRDGDALFGYGYGCGVMAGSGNSSYKCVILEFGYLGFFLLLTEWLFCLIKFNRKNAEGYLLILFFLISLYQRPRTIFFLYGYVITFGGLVWIRGNNESSNKKLEPELSSTKKEVEGSSLPGLP